MSLRIISLLLMTTTLMFAMGYAAYRAGAGSAQAPNCQAEAPLRTLTLTVPANRTVTFPLAELLPEADPFAAASEAILALTRLDGSLRIAAANETAVADARITPSGLTFAPQPGFTGVSTGWMLTMPAGDEAAAGSGPACDDRQGDGGQRASVLVTFEVRNSLPQAMDDEVSMPVVADLMDVGPEAGVLANDLDVNGDPLVVHATGPTTFPWGSVMLAADGSYRVVVTDRDQLAPATVRYVVWDQQGSPTSVDTGYLTIEFTEE